MKRISLIPDISSDTYSMLGIRRYVTTIRILMDAEEHSREMVAVMTGDMARKIPYIWPKDILGFNKQIIPINGSVHILKNGGVIVTPIDDNYKKITPIKGTHLTLYP